MNLVSVGALVVSVCGLLPQSESYNIDVSWAKVFQGSAGTAFGYTAEFMRSQKGAVSLVVGAPKETVTVQRSGVYYLCDPSSESNTCTGHTTARQPSKYNVTRDGRFQEDQELFGLTLTMADEHTAVVCGPLWSDLDSWYYNHAFWIGRCQIVSATGSGVGPGVTPYRNPRQYMDQKTRALTYGAAQFGFSADGDGKGRVVIGVPGAKQLTGEAAVLNAHSRRTYTMKIRLDPDTDIEIGYDVAVGNFCGDKRFCFAVSDRQVKGKVYLVEHLYQNMFRHLDSFQGDQEYSSFGSVLCAVDVTGDGWADLLVGAPTFTLFTNTTNYYDQGRVLVYISHGEVRPGGTDSFAKGTALNGAGLKFSRFGSAISSIGDINRDFINDIAVGAPMEEEGAGAVYVYLGSRDGPANKFSQKIRGKDFTPPLASFGTHIAKPTSQLSDYGYPAFAVGAPRSSAVVILRTRLIVNANVSIKATPNPVEGTNQLCPGGIRRHGSGCVNVTLCLRVQYHTADMSKSFRSTLAFNFDVHLEVDKLINTDGSQRVRLYNPEDGTTTTSLHLPLTITRTSPLCRKYVAVLKQDKINHNPFKPVQLEARFSLNTTAFPGVAPMLNQSMPDSVTHQLRLKNRCGHDRRCKADLVLKGHVEYVPRSDVSYPFHIINDTKQVELVLNVLNRGETSFGMMLSVNLTGPMDYWTATGNTTLLCEARHDSLLHCQGWAPLGNSEAVQVRLKFLADSLPLEPQNHWVTFQVKVTPSDPAENPESNMADNVLSLESQTAIVADVRLDGSSTPSVTHVADSDQADVSLTHKLLVTNRGPSFLPPTALLLTLPFLDSTASDILHSANVTIQQGEGRGARHCLHIPHSQGYVTDHMTATTPTTTPNTSPTTSPDPFGGWDDVPSKRRRRRHSEDAEGPSLSTTTATTVDESRLKRMDCDSYQCRTYKCPLTTLQANQRAEVNVKITLHRSSIVFSGNVSTLLFVTTSSVEEPRDFPLFYPWSERRIRKVRTQLKRISGGDEINIWYIIGGVIGGVLLLVIIVLIAWRAGFFKRKDKVRLERLKRQSGFYQDNTGGTRRSQVASRSAAGSALKAE
ncbi:integrin alpha-IIb-like [Babylonia areolata]|uniref:integrin alpha-IIb-like n=1 Tax=Babylonia areolata TaxID=304850 RepID=UPI003FD1EBD9